MLIFSKLPARAAATLKHIWVFCYTWIMTLLLRTAFRTFLSQNMLQSIGLTIPDLTMFRKM